MSEMSRAIACTLSILVLAAMARPAGAADPKRIGGSEIWGAYEVGDGNDRVCFVYGAPKDSRGDYTKRGDTYLQVAHRPGDKVRNEVSVTAGYPYKDGSDVDVDIDGRKFSLFTQNDGAWARDSKTDDGLVEAMIKGRTMVVRGRSSRDTLTVDTYSLSGFTQAYRSASQACNVPAS